MLNVLILGRAVLAPIRLDRAAPTENRPSVDGFTWMRALFG